MKQIEADITETLKKSVVQLGFEWVGCDYIAQGKRSLVRIYIDKPGGITLGDCQKAMEYISPILDVENTITGSYQLEVSSPGLDRPLFTIEDYQKFIGKEVNVKMKHPLNGRRNFKGQILEVTSNHLSLSVDGQPISLLFEDVMKANLVPDIK